MDITPLTGNIMLASISYIVVDQLTMDDETGNKDECVNESCSVESFV